MNRKFDRVGTSVGTFFMFVSNLHCMHTYSYIMYLRNNMLLGRYCKFVDATGTTSLENRLVLARNDYLHTDNSKLEPI